MALPDPQRSEEWDTLILGGVPIPGVTRVNVRVPSPLDVKQPKGAKRAYVDDKGFPPVEMHCETQLNGIAQINAFGRAVALLRPRGQDAPSEPLEVTHPSAREWGVNVVKVGDIDAPHPEAGARKFVNYVLVEWVPKPKKLRKPTDKPKNDDHEDWNVQPLIDALRPGNTNAAAENL